MRCGFRSEGSAALYTPAAMGFAPSRTFAAGDAAATGDAFGDLAGSGDAAGDAIGDGALETVGDASVVSAVGGAELAVAAVVGTCPDATAPPFATVKKFVASSYSRSPPTTDAVLTLPSERPSGLIFTTRP